jgi:hypothetical protein
MGIILVAAKKVKRSKYGGAFQFEHSQIEISTAVVEAELDDVCTRFLFCGQCNRPTSAR